MKLSSLDEVYFGHLRDLASSEKQLIDALGKLAEAATDENLRKGFEEHKEETQQHFTKIEEILKGAGKSARGRKCQAIEGLIVDSGRFLKATGDEGVKDAALAMAGKQTERFEIAAYQTAISMAVALERYEDAHALKDVLAQEYAADSKLGAFLESDCNVPATPEALSEATPRSELEGEALIESTTKNLRSTDMPRDYDDRYENDRGSNGYEGRARGGQHSAAVQERDEYGQFAGRGNRDYDRDDNGGRYSSGGSRGGRDYDRSDEDRRYSNSGGGRGGNFGGYEGRARGGEHSAEMQGRDEYGRFTGYEGGGSRGGQYSQGGGRGYDRDYDDDNGRRSSGGRGQGGGDMQGRDEYGRFTGSEGGFRGGQYAQGGGRGYDRDSDNDGGRRSGGGRGNYGGGGDITDSGGRHYSRESWERAQEGRSLGGQHSHGGNSGRDSYDDYDGGRRSGGRGSSGRDYDDNDGGRRSGGGRGNYGGGGDITDSAGRHYSRESWERAQEGRSRGGQHSHMNG